MSYAGERVIHDADSHIMEPGDCLDAYLTRADREQLHGLPTFVQQFKRADGRVHHVDREASAVNLDTTVLLNKEYRAHGAVHNADRPAALDALGFRSQLVFTTFCLGNFGLDQGKDMSLCYAAADAHNRMMHDFCAVDKRLLSVAYVPLVDPARTIKCAKQAIDNGASALMVPSSCPQTHSPSHVDLFPVWAMAQEAGIPILFHVGGEDKIGNMYKNNGLPAVKDFMGGDANFTSVSYMFIPYSVMQTVATLIFDGVFDKFPALKWGAIELGASWVPGWMRSMDSAAHAFARNEERLRNLSDKPSAIVQRQFRVAPYPHEDAGWVIANAGESVSMFSSDYPHIEGGRHPLKRFDATLHSATEEEKRRFYSDNFEDLMGAGLPRELRTR